MTRILLLRPDKAGDTLKTLPAVRALKIEKPNWELHVLGSTHNASLWETEPGITFHLSLSTLPSSDIAINLLCDVFEDVEKTLLTCPAKQHFSKFQDPAGTEESLNIARKLDEALKTSTASKVLSLPRAPVSKDADKAEAQEKLGEKTQPWIAICPFAGTGQRTHPLRHWKKFLKSLVTTLPKARFHLMGTPADAEKLQELKKVGGPQVAVVFPSSFRALGAYFSLMDGVIAVDSGPLHLALALGVPSLGFLSGGDKARWFSRTQPKDLLVPRGWLNRYPGPFQMKKALKTWKEKLDLD